MSDGIYCYIVVYDGALGNEGLLSLFSMLIFGACLSCLSPMHTQNVEKKKSKALSVLLVEFFPDCFVLFMLWGV